MRESQLLSLEDVQSQRALLESQVFSQRKDLEDSLFEAGSCSDFFKIVCGELKGAVFLLGPQGLLIDDICLTFYIYVLITSNLI